MAVDENGKARNEFSVCNQKMLAGEEEMRLPDVARRLRELALELKCEELSDLADEIGRRSSAQRAAATSVPMTDSLKAQIRAMKAAEPQLSQAEIGKRLNINPGRVSETLRGKRTWGFRAATIMQIVGLMHISVPQRPR
jgi:hypothetical protein